MNNTIRKGRKFEQVLEGARTVFMKDGFEGASVDDIARTAGVSKATLYSYFPDKRLLFVEVAKGECLRQAEHALDLIDTDAPPRDVLRDAGSRIIAFLTSELGRSVLSLCAAEAQRFPELGCEFYASGPGLVRDKLAEYLADATAAGLFEIDDFTFAADQYSELCKSYYFPRLLCAVQVEFSQEELDRVLTGAVDMFMARYGISS